MKRLGNKKTSKKLIIIIIALIILNALLPNFTYASSSLGGVFLEPLSKFTTFVCDAIMQSLQNSFVSTEDIRVKWGEYKFQYSPAIIFSGKVQALSVNFINPPEVKRIYKKQTTIVDFGDGGTIEEVSAKWGYTAQNQVGEKTSEMVAGDYDERQSVENLKWEYEGELYSCKFTDTGASKTWTITKETVTEEVSKEYKATAEVLQGTIATWYKVLRRISLVGLLSALVYIGIRIVLSSSSAKQKTKYKKMLIDWLVALCLLFTLHYLMNFIVVICNKLSDIFDVSSSDTLLNLIRNDIDKTQKWDQLVVQVIMYAAIMVFTLIYTVKYLKRVIYMAFFTMIAPLICLTYPLDKIKDGQAQAFNMWLKEYIFNALIQVVHLVVYFTLVGSAQALVNRYPLYALIVLGFLTKAEALIRKMFGFDNAKTIGTVGAAAAGGLISNALSKLNRPPKPPKGAEGAPEKGGGEGTKPVRTATNKDPLAALRGGTGASGNTGAGAATASSGGTGTEDNNATAQKTKKEWLNEEQKRKIKGAANVAMKYGGKSLDKALKFSIGGTGAMLGLAAGITQGDMSAALAGATAGAAAGKGVANIIENKAKSVANIGKSIGNIRETYESGSLGSAEAARNARFDRQFKRSSDYKALANNSNFSEDKIDAMLEAGITDKSTMEKLLNNGGNNIEEAIGYYTLAQKCDDSIYYDDDKLQTYIEDLGIDSESAEEIRKKMRAYR